MGEKVPRTSARCTKAAKRGGKSHQKKLQAIPKKSRGLEQEGQSKGGRAKGFSGKLQRKNKIVLIISFFSGKA